MDKIYSRKLKKNLLVYLTFGICLIGITIAFLAVHPLYDRLKHEQRQHLLHELEIKKLIVEEYIARARDTALQVTSRTQIRKKLDAYNRKEVSLEELREYSEPKLIDAMNLSQDMVGINRLDAGGTPVVTVGRPIPRQWWLLPDKSDRSVPIGGPLLQEGETHITLGANILDRVGHHVGTDIILFQTEGLSKIVEARVELGSGGETILCCLSNGAYRLFFPLDGGTEKQDEALLAELNKTAPGEELPPQLGTLPAGTGGESTQVYASASLRGTSWALVLRMDQGELFRAVNRQLLYIAATIALFILAGVYGMALLLRPLAGKILIHAEEMERQNVELRKVDTIKEGLLRDVSHELKTPVAKQVMQLEILKPIVEKHHLDERERNALTVMEENLVRQQTVIKNLLNLSRLESGSGIMKQEPVRLDNLIRQVRQDYLYAIEAYGIDFRNDVEAVTVTGDGDMLWHVFSNLVNNAIKFRRRDLTPSITVSTRKVNGELQVRVADNGVGLSTEETEKVFARFYQATASSEGSGVGLNIVKVFVEKMGGRIWLESPGPAKGTTAVVSIPLREDSQSTLEQTRPA